MRKIACLISLLCAVKILQAQIPSIYTITADSVKITNDCDTAELIIENHTQNVPGFLFNRGRAERSYASNATVGNNNVFIGLSEGYEGLWRAIGSDNILIGKRPASTIGRVSL